MKSETPQEKLEKTRRFADEMISRSPAVAFIWKNAEGWPVEYVTSNVHTIFGWNRDDFLTGRTLYADVVHPEDLPRVLEEVRRYSADTSAGRVLHAPYRTVTREGSVRWVEDFTAILRNEDGSVASYEGFLIDVTERKEMEEKIQLIQFSIDRAAEGIAWIDAEGRIIYANDEECRRRGYTREEFMKLTVFDVDPTLTPQSLEALWSELRLKGTVHLETEHRTRSGEIFPVEGVVQYIRFNDKEYSFAFMRDITERKRADAEQKRLQANLINALEIADLGPWEHDHDKDIFTVNDNFFKVYRTTIEQVGSYTMSSEEYFRQFIHPDDVSYVRTEIQRIAKNIENGKSHKLEHRILFPDGSTHYVAALIFLIKDATGRIVKSYGVNQDITERKLAERERIANLKYFECMEKVNQAIQGGGNNLDLILKSVLDVCLSVFNCDRAFLLHPCDPDAPFWHLPMGRSRPGFESPHDPSKMIPMNSYLASVLRIALAASGPVSFLPGAVHSLPEEVMATEGFRSQMIIALQTKIGKPWLFGLHQCDDARIWTAEEENLFEKIARRLTDSLTSLLMYRDLRKSEEFLNGIVENIPDAIIVKDAEDLSVLRINRAGEKLFGLSREEIIGKSSFGVVSEKQDVLYAASDREVIDGRVPVEIPEDTLPFNERAPRIIHAKKIPILDETGKARHLLVIAEDITELKKLQAQLTHAQKLEALGTMSGGIAHDFNNILQPMLGYSEFLMKDLAADSPQHKFVEGIFNAVLRAKDLVNQILVFSRQSDRQMVPVALPRLLKEAVNLCRSIIPSNIEINRDIQKDCASVWADPTQLHQIIMNLMINAYHAMEETGGEIIVTLKEIRLGEDDLKSISLPPGKYARLSITDTGCGMAPAVLEKIFEPYFTTKAQGKGSGLGLAVVYGIVKEHGGHIHVYSEEGKGTTFNVYLPLMEKVTEMLPAEKLESYPAAGREHILLVDDEEMIVELESRMLERFGYRVTSSCNGAEALKIFRESPDAFDLVITDMNMPNMTGDRLARELIAIRPDIPIIICTGFSERISSAEAKALGVKEFLMKPITISEMAEKVRKVLDEA